MTTKSQLRLATIAASLALKKLNEAKDKLAIMESNCRGHRNQSALVELLEDDYRFAEEARKEALRQAQSS